MLTLAALALVQVGDSFDVQYAEPFVLDRAVTTLVLDADEFDAGVIAGLRDKGVRVLCYVSVGTIEDWRSDVAQVPAKAIGKPLPDWEGERYLDIRNRAVLVPLMAQRFQTCADKGFAGVSPDNIDVFANDSGFAISREDALAYLRDLAAAAHGLDLLIGQKNAPDLAPDLAATLDFVIAESCWHWRFCGEFADYTALGKPIFDIEYTDETTDFPAACAEARKVGISMILKDRNLSGGVYESCR